MVQSSGDALKRIATQGIADQEVGDIALLVGPILVGPTSAGQPGIIRKQHDAQLQKNVISWPLSVS